MEKHQARSDSQKTPRKPAVLQDKDNILARFMLGCCRESRCLWNHFSVDSITLLRKRYSIRNEFQRTQLLRRFAERALRRNPDGKVFWEWNVQGHRVCAAAMCALFGCSKAKLFNAKKEYCSEVNTHG